VEGGGGAWCGEELGVWSFVWGLGGLRSLARRGEVAHIGGWGTGMHWVICIYWSSLSMSIPFTCIFVEDLSELGRSCTST